MRNPRNWVRLRRRLGWLSVTFAVGAAVACGADDAGDDQANVDGGSDGATADGRAIDSRDGATASGDATTSSSDADVDAETTPNDANSDAGMDSSIPSDGSTCDADRLGDCVIFSGLIPDSNDEVPRDPDGGGRCPNVGELGYGQDCNYRINVPTLTVQGGVALDSVTGLLWSRELPGPDAGGADGSLDYPQSEAYCASLGVSQLGGFSDWRMPTAREVMTLIDSGQNSPGFDRAFAPLTFNIRLLTSTTFDNVNHYTLIGNWPVFTGGSVGNGNHCVRGGPLPASVLTVSASGNVIDDSATKLQWQRDVTGSGNWRAAVGSCQTLVLDGHDDWRLPNFKELWSIVAPELRPAISDSFKGPATDVYWSASPAGRATLGDENAYAIKFNDGSSELANPMSEVHQARCVRTRS